MGSKMIMWYIRCSLWIFFDFPHGEFQNPESISLIITDPILLHRVGPEKQQHQPGKLLEKRQVFYRKQTATNYDTYNSTNLWGILFVSTLDY